MDSLPFSLLDITSSHWARLALLFAVALVLEEGAMVAAALLAAAGEVPAPGAASVVFAGIMLGDWVVYALGRLAARVDWIRSRFDPDTLARGQRYLEGRLFGALLLARVTPWLLFPVFLSCGFIGVAFRRFALLNVAIAAVYTGLLFAAGLVFGQIAFDHLKSWGWLAAGLLLLAVAAGPYLLRRRTPPD